MTTDASERQENEGKRFVETSEGEIAVRTLNFGSLVPTAYDYIALTIKDIPTKLVSVAVK